MSEENREDLLTQLVYGLLGLVLLATSAYRLYCVLVP